MPAGCMSKRLAIMALGVFAAAPLAMGGENNFFRDKERGWYWYEDPLPVKPVEKPKEEPIPPKVPAPTAKEQPNLFSAEWLRKNLDRLRDDAIDNPDDKDKVAAYMYAQRVLMDKAQRFASAASVMAKTDPLLDETTRVPLDTAAAAAFHRGIEANKGEAIKLLAKKGGILFFFDSSCSFCMTQTRALRWLEKESGFTVLNISIDGKPIEGMARYVKDTGQAAALRLKMTPTTIYAVPPDKYYIISQGYHSADTLLDKIMTVAVTEKLLPEHMIEIQRGYERGVLTAGDMRDPALTSRDDTKEWVRALQERLGNRY